MSRPRNIALVCACCGNPFLATRQDARFCSQQCTTEAYEEKVRQKRKAAREAKDALGLKAPRRPPPKVRLGARRPTLMPTCISCGNAFPATRKDAKFCSKKCGNAEIERRQKSIRAEKLKAKQAALSAQGLAAVTSNRCGPREKKFVKHCIVCAAAFSTTREDARFCSANCRNDRRVTTRHTKRLEALPPEETAPRTVKKERIHQLQCAHCKQAFMASRPDAKFCSANCRTESYMHVMHLRRTAAHLAGKKNAPAATIPPPTPMAAGEHHPLVIDPSIVDLRTLCYLTSISRSAMYRLLQDCPDFPMLKVKGSTRFPKEAAVRYITSRFSVSGEQARKEPKRGP